MSDNELPNSPHWAVNLGAEYTIPLSDGWGATVRGDGYWQGKSWARVYNLTPYDRLRDWTKGWKAFTIKICTSVSTRGFRDFSEYSTRARS
ncbi:hypothetical protein [Sphingopyxis sp. MG]|uniref:hypothetical protein n=1 Tax=Sphingopyxis sp. MG TaxID=1866325 RepID=UPI000CDF41DA|nr:hypothetical protein [Sphingopyxis sp. MG]AVA12948.1 hypothetical protein C3E99_03020 [Sphingopyxis sp. MG]